MRNTFTKEQLEHEYLTLKLDTTKIGKKYGITGGAVWQWLKKYDIPRRSSRAGGINIKDLTGRKFGRLTVIKKVDNPSNTSAKWLCTCECGRTKEIVGRSLITKVTRSCGCKHRSILWKGCGELGSTFWSHIRTGARRRNLLVSITLKEAWDLYLKQNKKCALTGVDLHMEMCYSTNRTTHTASLDRIDSSKGYTVDNVQWVHKRINIMKSNMSDNEFIKTCQQIVDHNKR